MQLISRLQLVGAEGEFEVGNRSGRVAGAS